MLYSFAIFKITTSHKNKNKINKKQYKNGRQINNCKNEGNII